MPAHKQHNMGHVHSFMISKREPGKARKDDMKYEAHDQPDISPTTHHPSPITHHILPARLLLGRTPTTTIHAPQRLLLRTVLLPRPVVALRLRLLRLCDGWSIPRESSEEHQYSYHGQCRADDRRVEEAEGQHGGI